MKAKKIKLSERQWELMKALRETFSELKFSSINNNTAKSLIKMKLVDYNSRFDGIVLTELGKTFEL